MVSCCVGSGSNSRWKHLTLRIASITLAVTVALLYGVFHVEKFFLVGPVDLFSWCLVAICVSVLPLCTSLFSPFFLFLVLWTMVCPVNWYVACMVVLLIKIVV